VKKVIFPLLLNKGAGMLGVDVSKHQGIMDWDKAKKAGVEYAFIRCTVGDYYTDTQFENNYTNLTRLGIPFGMYHVVVPDRPVYAQVKRIMSVISGKTFLLPIALDCELTGNVDTAAITANIEGIAEQLETNGYKVMIYTSQGFWNSYVKTATTWKKYPLWVANYVKNYDPISSSPLLPRDWDTWMVWQYSADGNLLGPTYGASGSKSIDLNRFDGDMEELLTMTKKDETGSGNMTTLDEIISKLEEIILVLKSMKGS
jgi:GH25 family lysozyme M1 (1,4-beta-N-acetylmuramidase)